MAEILLIYGHRREALLRRGSVGWVCKGDLPLHGFFFGFEAKLVHFQSLFFLNFVYISWIKIKSKTTIF